MARATSAVLLNLLALVAASTGRYRPESLELPRERLLAWIDQSALGRAHAQRILGSSHWRRTASRYPQSAEVIAPGVRLSRSACPTPTIASRTG